MAAENHRHRGHGHSACGSRFPWPAAFWPIRATGTASPSSGFWASACSGRTRQKNGASTSSAPPTCWPCTCSMRCCKVDVMETSLSGKNEREAFVVPITTCPFHTQKWRSKRLPCTGEPSARKGRQRVCSLPGLACLLAWRKKPRRENSVLSGGAVLFIWYSRGPATSRNHSGPPYLCSVSLRWGRRIQTRRRRNSRCTNPPLG